MTHLKAKSFADYSQKLFEERVKKTIKKGEQSLAEVVATQELQAQRERERREKYPMCTRLSNASGERTTINNFVEWLQEQGIWLCDRDEGSNFSEYRPISKRSDSLIMEYLEIDEKALEKERRQLLDEQRKANGDTEEEDAPG